jgi:hypothetical protein
LFCTKIRILHEVELIDRVRYRTRRGNSVVVVRMRRLQFQILQRQSVRRRLVQMVEIRAVVQGDVGAAEALARVRRISIVRRVRNVGVERLAGTRKMRITQIAHTHEMSMVTRGRLLLDDLVVLVRLVLVSGRLAVVLLRLALDLLHLGPLVLEPDLDHPHAQARLLGQRLPHFAAGLGADLERGLELAPLRRRQDGAGSLGPPAPVPRPAVLVEQVVVAGAGLLHQVHLLLEVLSAEELARPQHELLALLQGLATHHAYETGQMKDVLLRPHYHFVGEETVAAS